MDYEELFWDIHRAVTNVYWREWQELLPSMPTFHFSDNHGPDPAPTRWWWKAAADKYDAHPAVLAMLRDGYRANDMHLLVLQWPHVSESDPERLAYYQSEQKGKRDLATVTTVGKYLARHFDAPDHVIRDTARIHAQGGTFGITRNMEEMLDIITDDTIYSCMVKFGRDHHPYRVYDPSYGWGLASRRNARGELAGRALVYHEPNSAYKCFVRSYLPNEAGADIKLQAWLESQGYEDSDGWPVGAKLARIEYGSGALLAPYLDGINDDVKDCDEYLVIKSYSSDMKFTDSTGYVSWALTRCEDCNDRTGELTSVGRDEDRDVCESCLNSYVYVIGGRGNWAGYREYYIPDDDAVCVDDTWVDPDNLPRGYVKVDHGSREDDIVPESLAIRDLDGGYWHDDDIVYDPEDSGVIEIQTGRHEGDWEDSSCTFRCLHDGLIHHDDDGYESVDGGYVASDNFDEWKAAQGDDDDDDDDEDPDEVEAETQPEVTHV